MDPAELRRKNFITEFPATLAVRARGRLRRLRRRARPGARDRSTTTRSARSRPSGGRPGRREAARHRLLDLHRDVRPRAVADPRRDPLRRRRLGRGDDPLPADRHGAGRHRHLAARAGARDDVLADRRRPARRVDSTTVEVLHGDTTVSPLGLDTYGSRSPAVGGVALWNATEKVIAKAKAIAAHQLEVAEDDLEYADGTLHGRGHRQGDDGARRRRSRPGRRTTCRTGWSRASRRPPSTTRRTSAGRAGCHIAVVEVDTETGDGRLDRYVAVDEIGTVINPTIVDGQVHGGIAQGVAQALFEEADLRQRRQPRDRLDAQLPGAVGGRAAVVRARPHRDAEPDEPARRQGRRRDRRDRVDRRRS